MNFNYSYKAFLIATLLVGNLILLMYSVKLSKTEEIQEEEYEIEYTTEDLFPEEKLATISSENVKVETHKAFNEAEKFISEIEKENEELSESTQDKIDEMNAAIEGINTKPISSKNSNKTIPNKKEIKKTSFKKESGDEESNNPNSTNSYRLVNRKALHFPNPVYTCEGFGKVVLHIEVNNLGKVLKATLNKNSTTTTNECLIESAIHYAKKARFTSAANKPLQMGSITYIFPGQR